MSDIIAFIKIVQSVTKLLDKHFLVKCYSSYVCRENLMDIIYTSYCLEYRDPVYCRNVHN